MCEKCEWCEISNGRTIPKFANCRNFNSLAKWKNVENFLIFQFGKFQKFII